LLVSTLADLLGWFGFSTLGAKELAV